MITRTLYDKNNREIRFNIIFGAVASIILFLLAAVVVVNNFVFVKVYVYGASMEPTLHTGDIVMINVYREPDYGDIIVISGEKANGDWLIKRAIAFGGDTVMIKDGYVYLKKAGETEFTKMTEPYLARQGITVWEGHNGVEFNVGEGQVFYLGDNRTNSSDSRSAFGTCGTEQIEGVVSEFSLALRGINGFFDRLLSPIKKLFAQSA